MTDRFFAAPRARPPNRMKVIHHPHEGLESRS